MDLLWWIFPKCLGRPHYGREWRRGTNTIARPGPTEGILLLGAGCWMLGAECWVLDAGDASEGGAVWRESSCRCLEKPAMPREQRPCTATRLYMARVECERGEPTPKGRRFNRRRLFARSGAQMWAVCIPDVDPPGRAFLIGGRACVLVQAAAAPCLPPRLPLVANHERTPHRRARESVSSASRKMDPAFSPIPVFWDQNPRISTSGRFSRSDAKNGLKLCQGAHGQPAAACPTGVPVVLALRG